MSVPGEGRRVLITGAASGLGAALADEFTARGDQVLRTDRVESDLVDLKLDITSDEDWERAREFVLARWSGLDILVNNAGIAGGGRLDVATMADWHRMLDVNLLGVVRGIATFTPIFKQAEFGAIINVASLAGLVHPAGMGSYNAAKAAVVALTETASHELASFGVTAHAVCPSYFRTNLLDSLQDTDAALGAVMSHLVTHAPLGADDIARSVLEAFDEGQTLIIPDQMAQAAVELKRVDPEAYAEVMRGQADNLHRLARDL